MDLGASRRGRHHYKRHTGGDGDGQYKKSAPHGRGEQLAHPNGLDDERVRLLQVPCRLGTLLVHNLEQAAVHDLGDIPESGQERRASTYTQAQTNKKKDTTTALRRGKLHEWVQLKPIGGGYVHVHLKSHTCFSASTRRAHMVLWTSLLAAWPARSRR